MKNGITVLQKIQKPIVQQISIGSVYKVVFHKDERYFILTDIATWSKCGHIKTILPMEIIFDSDIKKIKKLKKLIVLKTHEQMIVKFGKTYAIYNINVYPCNLDNNLDKEKIRTVSLTKIPNLHMCKCGG